MLASPPLGINFLYRQLLLLLLVFGIALPVSAQVGGGFAGGGLSGEYFANPDLTGSPAFTRRELRLDFDWGTLRPIGGSNDVRYRTFPLDQFSARFSGTIIPTFSETYTFTLVADDGARLFIRPEGGSTWTPLLDQWNAAGTHTASYALTRGTRYELRVEYRELSGAAALRLLWSSPSTPTELLEPLMNQGFNISYWSQVFADITRSARNSWETNNNGTVTMDANGWPENDASLIFQESLNQGLGVDPLMSGTVQFSFKGKADVRMQGNARASASSDSTTVAVTYDPATNTSSGTFYVTDKDSNATYLKLSNTDRDGQVPARKNGITELKLMRPTAPDAPTTYDPSVIFTDHARAATAKFTALRVNLNNANAERFWSDRTLPTYFNQRSGKSTLTYYKGGVGLDPAPTLKGNGPSWEHSIMLANETGADLYINIPAMASGWSPADTDSYVYQLARLLRYGSDGVNPYSAPTANPAYPPLNPNLRVYVEFTNEVWNYAGAFRQYHDINEMMKVDARTALGTPTENDLIDPLARPTDFPILNYDNLPTTTDLNGNYTNANTWRMRKAILRIIQISDIFRAVWGDDAMHTRIRPLYEWQYENKNSTASMPLKFINDYFNNGDGLAHVANPHPVNHFLWGGGGASYYGALNGYGVTDQIADPGFETPALPGGYNPAPVGSSWTFTGTAGIARDTGDSDDIPPGWDGSAQCAYIAGTGSISLAVTLPDTQVSNTYAFVFKALQRVRTDAPLDLDGKPIPDTQQLRIFVNDLPLNWKSFNQSGGYTPKPYDATKPWNAFVVYWTPTTPYYSSSTFTGAPGETVTLRIEGTAADQIAFLEDVRLSSVDRMFADGFPGGGEANGQPAGSGYQNGLNIQASWALAYGLRYVTYEGGWSLGGDTGGTPLQNTGKFLSSEAASANRKAIDMFHQAGGYLNTFGTYSLWPSWSEALAQEGLLDVSAYPLISSQEERMNTLRAEPTNGLLLPAVLSPVNAVLGGTGSFSAYGWKSWNIISPGTHTYTVAITTTTGTTAQLWLDGAPVGTPFTTGGTTTLSLPLTKGLHGLRLQGADGTFALESIAFAIDGAPDATTITGITDGNGTKTIEWSAVAGATGYLVRWGTESGNYPEIFDVSSGTTHTLTGLLNNQTYYIIVTAYNAAGPALPSPEVGSIALVDGQPGRLATWDFAGTTGNEATATPSTSTSRLTITPLTRGPGLKLSTYSLEYTADSFAYMPQGSATTPAEALTLGHYTEFTVTPQPGTRVSLTDLSFAPYWQKGSEAAGGAGLAYSINGGAFTLATLTGTPSSNQGTPLSADLSGQPSLQNLTVPVTFRLLHPNLGRYSFAGLGRHTGDDVLLQGSVSLVPPPTPYDTWAIDTGLTGTAALPDADPDGDGIHNFLEYALGTAPDSSASRPNLETQISNFRLQITFLRARAELTYRVEASNDLATWTVIATNPGSVSLTTPVTLTDTLDLSTAQPPRRFLRLRVSQP